MKKALEKPNKISWIINNLDKFNNESHHSSESPLCESGLNRRFYIQYKVIVYLNSTGQIKWR